MPSRAAISSMSGEWKAGGQTLERARAAAHHCRQRRLERACPRRPRAPRRRHSQSARSPRRWPRRARRRAPRAARPLPPLLVRGGEDELAADGVLPLPAAVFNTMSRPSPNESAPDSASPCTAELLPTARRPRRAAAAARLWSAAERLVRHEACAASRCVASLGQRVEAETASTPRRRSARRPRRSAPSWLRLLGLRAAQLRQL